ncbi:MAG: hypothetical protein ABIJ41_08215 [Candidatus Omnitrophota bacterium]
MSEQVQELINKIKSEGIQEAQNKAKQIEAEARKKAEGIVQDARKQAQQIVAQAAKDQELLKEKTEKTLQQAARDMILSLKKEIQKILHDLIAQDIKSALSTDELAEIITQAVNNFLKDQSKGDRIMIALNKGDHEKLKKDYLAKLKEKIKDGIEFKPTDQIDKGFTISFDSGKSFFDFTDESLAGYLSAMLSPEIANLFKNAFSS